MTERSPEPTRIDPLSVADATATEPIGIRAEAGASEPTYLQYPAAQQWPAQPSPEPSAPLASGGLRASDADRDQVAGVLGAAFAEGRITREEHDERLDRLMRSKTFDELVALTSDLVPTPAPASQPAAYVVDASAPGEATENLVAIFGGVNRQGRWRARKKLHALALFGGIDLNFREAIFENSVVEISGIWCFGGLDIKVPAGIEVRDHTVGIFGGTEMKDLGEPVPGAPTIVIKGVALFGGVSVRGPKESRRRRT